MQPSVTRQFRAMNLALIVTPFQEYNRRAHAATAETPLTNTAPEHATLGSNQKDLIRVAGRIMNFTTDSKQVYPVLAQHQVTEPWEYQSTFQKLHYWAEEFNVQCALDVPNIALQIEPVQSTTLGYYRVGHNGFGFTNAITINKLHLDRDEFSQVLETLLHEMVHAWEATHGKSSSWCHHSAAFRNKMASVGIHCDRRGHHISHDPAGLFFQLLKAHDISPPEVPPAKPKLPGRSPYKKWSCGCTNVRVAVADFHAKCLRCDKLFVRVK